MYECDIKFQNEQKKSGNEIKVSIKREYFI